MDEQKKRGLTNRAGGKGGPSGRQLKQRVKSAGKRKLSSTRWLERQLNDPYVAAARRAGFRSRAAFKLIELDDKFKFLKPGCRVVDLGAAPGGWTQIAVERVRSDIGASSGCVVALDINPVESLAGATILQGDFLADDTPERIRSALNGKADVVLSDMASPATGHKSTDHLRVMALCESAHDFAMQILSPGGIFVAKVLKGGTEHTLLQLMKGHFQRVQHAKPPASRADSSETYVVARGFQKTAS